MLKRNADAALRLLTLAAIFGLSAAAQTRDDSFPLANVEVTEAQLLPAADGGCSVRWCGSATSADGGVTIAACSEAVPLKNATNINRCAAILSAGVPRIARELRFAGVDAGAP